MDSSDIHGKLVGLMMLNTFYKENEGKFQDCGDNLRTKLTTGNPQGEGGRAKNKAIGANSSTGKGQFSNNNLNYNS